MDNVSEQLKYPIGRYKKPDTTSASLQQQWIAELEALPLWMDACIENLDHAELQTPSRDGGWTIQQVVHHVADSHLNAYIRLKLALTEDNPTVKPYNEQAWAELPDTQLVPVNVSVTMLHTLHRRMVALLKELTPDQWERTYFHPEHQRNFPVWEMVALYAWHGRHHTEHIKRLRDKMGVS